MKNKIITAAVLTSSILFADTIYVSNEKDNTISVIDFTYKYSNRNYKSWTKTKRNFIKQW